MTKTVLFRWLLNTLFFEWSAVVKIQTPLRRLSFISSGLVEQTPYPQSSSCHHPSLFTLLVCRRPVIVHLGRKNSFRYLAFSHSIIIWEQALKGCHRYSSWDEYNLLHRERDQAQQVRALAAPPEGQSSVPSTHVNQLIITYDSSRKRSDTFFCLLRVLHSHVRTHIKIHINLPWKQTFFWGHDLHL